MKLLVGFDVKDYPSVSCFEELGECDFIRYDMDYLYHNIGKYDVIVPHLFLYLGEEILKLAKNLKVLATPSTGKDHLNLETLASKGTIFLSLNDNQNLINQISSTAEHAWLLILACSRNLIQATDRVQIDKSWINTEIRGNELRGKTIGIVGYGRLGKLVSKYATAFGMNVLAFDTDQSAYDQNCNPCDLDVLYSSSDIISFHAKLNHQNNKMFSYSQVEMLKPNCVIVNTARGELLDSEAILNGIKLGKISSVGLDVLTNEFEEMLLPADPLIDASKDNNKIIITPHIGGSTIEAHNRVFGGVKELIIKSLEMSID